MKRIEVIVSPKGESRIETFGFEGSTCRSVTSQLEKALGTHQTESLKPEFYTNQTNNIQQQEQQ